MTKEIIRQRSQKEWLIDFVILGVTALTIIMYFVFNQPAPEVYVLRSFIDEWIPRLAFFVVPYLLFIPWFWGSLVYIFLSKANFRRFALATIAINIVAFFVYVFFQTYVPRDPILETDIFSQILSWLYSSDKPYAGFPSLHSAMSASVATFFYLNNSKNKWLVVFFAGLIIISTLFTKQHFVADAISGILLGTSATWLLIRAR